MLNKEKKILLVLASVKFAHIMDFMIIMPLGPQLMRVMDIEPHEFGWLVSSYAMSAFLFGLVGSLVMDWFDRRKLLLWVMLGFTSGTLACGFADNLYTLLAARFVAGMFGGVLSALVLAIVGDVVPEERRAQGVGLVMAAFSAASALGVPFGLYLANLYNWKAPFLLLGLLCILATFFTYWIVPPIGNALQKPRRLNFGMYRSILSGPPDMLLALALSILLILGQFIVIPFISPYMVGNVGMTEAQLPLIYLLGGALTIFTGPLIGYFADRFGKKRVFAIMVIISLLPLFLITHLPKVGLIATLFVTSLFFVFISGRTIPSTALVLSTIPPPYRGGFMSLQSALIQLGMAVATTIGGWLVVKNPDASLSHYDFVGYLGMAVSVLCIFIAIKIKPYSS